MTPGRQEPEGIRRSERLFRLFARYAARYLRRHIHGLRLASWGQPPAGTDGRPLVVYSNHPSWWDALVYILLAHRMFPQRHGYAPMDAAMLQRYRIFHRLGAFAVEPETPAGAKAFLSHARAILADPAALLFVSAPGRFVDVRVRPQGVKAGVAWLPEIAPTAILVPLAIEPLFWDERKPELLLAFGTPALASELATLSRPARRLALERSLHDTMDRLRDAALTRDPAGFDSLLSAGTGVGGLYDLWGRLGATLRGRRFDPSHRGAPR
jgi:hypothetical protein